MVSRFSRGEDGKQKNLCLVEFDGIIESSVRAKLIAEIIKFLVYHRQQIPLPFDQMKQEMDRIRETEHREEQEDSITLTEHIRRRRTCHAVESKKRRQTLSALEELFNHIDQAFVKGDLPIKQVLIVIGATVVSPKESYLVRLPSSCYDGNFLELKQCMSTLFRRLVTYDALSDLKPAKPSKMTLLIHASRDCDSSLSGFLPRMNYKLPNRGKRYVIDLVYRSKPVDPNLSRLEDSNFDISGIVPLDGSDMDLSLGASFAVSFRKTSCSESGSMDIETASVSREVTSSHLEPLDKSDNKMQESLVNAEQYDDPTYIWYQCKVFVKGFKDKTVRKASKFSL